ncbi:MAG TPA: hypothetical protein PK955_08740, partial [Methanoregulaceae archaeon]|nr:hypothetical protein [Methanoregulaceae archaeon]
IRAALYHGLLRENRYPPGLGYMREISWPDHGSFWSLEEHRVHDPGEGRAAMKREHYLPEL